MSYMSNFLRVQLGVSRDARAAELRSSLRRLQTEIAMALNDLEAGNQLDSHLIHNHNMLTESIARWNMLWLILPTLEAMKETED